MIDFIFSWTMLWWFLLMLYIPACVGLIIVVLMQKGKGVGFAGAFGMGGSEAVFGPRTARSLPQKMTYTAGAIFMIVALLLSVVTGKVGRGVAPDTVEEHDEAAIAESTALDTLFGDEVPEGEILLEDPAESPALPAGDQPEMEQLDEALEDDFPPVPVSPLEEPLEPDEAAGDTEELDTDLELDAPSFGDVNVEILQDEDTPDSEDDVEAEEDAGN